MDCIVVCLHLFSLQDFFIATIYKNHQTHFSNWSNFFSPFFIYSFSLKMKAGTHPRTGREQKATVEEKSNLYKLFDIVFVKLVAFLS